jgi:hypothetical protein
VGWCCCRKGEERVGFGHGGAWFEEDWWTRVAVGNGCRAVWMDNSGRLQQI